MLSAKPAAYADMAFFRLIGNLLRRGHQRSRSDEVFERHTYTDICRQRALLRAISRIRRRIPISWTTLCASREQLEMDVCQHRPSCVGLIGLV